MQPKDETSPGPQQPTRENKSSRCWKEEFPSQTSYFCQDHGNPGHEARRTRRIGWINVSLRTHLYDHWATILPGKERRRSSLYFSLFGCESLHFQKIPPDEERTRTSLQHMQYTLSEICQLLDVKGTCIAHSFPDRGTDKMRDSRIAPDATCYFSLYLAVYVLGGQQNVGWYIVDVYWLAGRTFRARAAALRNGSHR